MTHNEAVECFVRAKDTVCLKVQQGAHAEIMVSPLMFCQSQGHCLSEGSTRCSCRNYGKSSNVLSGPRTLSV